MGTDYNPRPTASHRGGSRLACYNEEVCHDPHYLHHRRRHRNGLTALVSLVHITLARGAVKRVGAGSRADPRREAATAIGRGDDIS